MSSFIPSEKGSITVEAAIVVPIFIFAIVNLLSIIDIIRLQSNVEMAMHQTGRKMAVYAYTSKNFNENSSQIMNIIENISFTNSYVKEEVLNGIGREYLKITPIIAGEKEIDFSKTEIRKDDRIDLVAEYHVKAIISLIGFYKIPLMNRCRMRAWTGYDNTKSDASMASEEYVYITETGNVYHTDKECTHLKLTIHTTTIQEVANLRNENGNKYKICELCGKEDSESKLYITEQGDRYHKNYSCSGLKRTIYTILLSETGGRALCQRCKGGNNS